MKKINSSLSLGDCLSLFVTALTFLGAIFYFYSAQHNSSEPVTYEISGTAIQDAIDERPFASILGKTYTFSWCQNSTAISAKNKLYFKDEMEAVASGRTLSKLCQK